MSSRRPKIQTLTDLQNHVSDALTILRSACNVYPTGPQEVAYANEAMDYFRDVMEECRNRVFVCDLKYFTEIYLDANKLAMMIDFIAINPNLVTDGFNKWQQMCALLRSHSMNMDHRENNLFSFGRKKSVAKKRRSGSKVAKKRRSGSKRKSVAKKRRSGSKRKSVVKRHSRR